MTFSGDGHRILLATFTALVVRDAATGLETRRMDVGGGSNISEASFSADGSRAVVCSSFTPRATVWDVDSSRELRTLQPPSGVESVAITRDGKTVLTGGGQGFDLAPGDLILWDAATGQRRQTFRGHRSAVIAVALRRTNDGRFGPCLALVG